MTNAAIIAAIRNEIERRKKSLRAGICNEEVFTRKQRKEMLVASEELDRLNRFLSTFKSEKPVPNDLEEAADEFANKHYSEWDESWDDYNGHNVEPENDKLELMDAFIAGAKWMSIHGNDIKEL